jgi:hypothetical protein
MAARTKDSQLAEEAPIEHRPIDYTMQPVAAAGGTNCTDTEQVRKTPPSNIAHLFLAIYAEIKNRFAPIMIVEMVAK